MSYFSSVNTLDLAESIILTGKFKGRNAWVFSILGSRTTFVDATTLHDINPFSASYLFNNFSSSDSLEIVSSSVNDTSAGTGTRTIRITYLDGSGLLANKTVTMNGTTPVSAFTANQANHILWLESITGGTSEVSAGNIDLRITGAGTIIERIVAGGNRSESCLWKTPSNCTAYIKEDFYSILNQNGVFKLRIQTSQTTGLFVDRYLFKGEIALSQQSSIQLRNPMRICPAGAKAKISVIPSATGGTPKAMASFTVICIQNP